MTDHIFTPFVRRPFVVHAIRITEANIEELAPMIGELQIDDKGKKLIIADKSKVPSVNRVWPGFWLTKMGSNLRCFSPRIFNEQFHDLTPEVQEWVDYMASPGQELKQAVPAVVETDIQIEEPTPKAASTIFSEPIE